MVVSRFSWVVLGSLLVSFSSCDPVPRRPLTEQEKRADLEWIYSQFGQNYAPLRYKEHKFAIDFEYLKKKYLEDAVKTKTNEEFYNLLFQFISEFKDAHTSGALTESDLPGRVQIAYMGFSGAREKDYLVIQSLLPTYVDGMSDEKKDKPKVGDHILKVDGVAIAEKAKELYRYRDLGRDESNLTYHMNKLFTRISTMNGMPTESTVTLEIRRGNETFSVTLPWIVRDLVEFREEQAAKKKEAEEKKSSGDEEEEKVKTRETGRFALLSKARDKAISLNLIGFDGRIQFPVETLMKIARATRKTVMDGFQLVDAYAGWAVAQTQAEMAAEESPEARIRKARYVPEKVVFLNMAKTYPAYISREKKEDGTEVMVGFIQVDTFSPSVFSGTALNEFVATIDAMTQLGVENLVLDLINNGGGSLQLGMQMAQALTAERLIQPTIRFRLSDSWMDQFETEYRDNSTSNVERELGRRMLVDMQADQAAGEWLSRAYPVEALMPYTLRGNPAVKKPFKIAVMVNEMCASMCDIFSAVLKDNGLATIVGSNSMGAGGNVVNYQQAPNSHLDLRQTESLIYRRDGSEIENNGVAPDVAVKVSDYTSEKYQTVRTEAIKALLK